jgi:hypothetical protein
MFYDYKIKLDTDGKFHARNKFGQWDKQTNGYGAMGAETTFSAILNDVLTDLANGNATIGILPMASAPFGNALTYQMVEPQTLRIIGSGINSTQLLGNVSGAPLLQINMGVSGAPKAVFELSDMSIINQNATDGTGSASTTTNGSASSGQKVVPVTATTGFVPGMFVRLNTIGSTDFEYGQIASIQSGVSLTMQQNLANNHSSGEPVTQVGQINGGAGAGILNVNFPRFLKLKNLVFGGSQTSFASTILDPPSPLSKNPAPLNSYGIFINSVSADQTILENITCNWFEVGFDLEGDHFHLLDCEARYCNATGFQFGSGVTGVGNYHYELDMCHAVGGGGNCIGIRVGAGVGWTINEFHDENITSNKTAAGWLPRLATIDSSSIGGNLPITVNGLKVSNVSGTMPIVNTSSLNANSTSITLHDVGQNFTGTLTISLTDATGRSIVTAPSGATALGNYNFSPSMGFTDWVQGTVTNGTGIVAYCMFLYNANFMGYLIELRNYKNTTGTADTITYHHAFSSVPTILDDPAGTSSSTTTQLNLPTNMTSGIYGLMRVIGLVS